MHTETHSHMHARAREHTSLIKNCGLIVLVITAEISFAKVLQQYFNSAISHNRYSESSHDRVSLATPTDDQSRMHIEGVTPLLAGSHALPSNSGDNATKCHAHCPLPRDVDLPVNHEVAPLPDCFRISPRQQPASDAVSSMLPTDVHDACVHDKAPQDVQDKVPEARFA